MTAAMESRCAEVLVLGAGPAGCSTAAVLAERGHDVLLVDKERFPRYRIGESLIPHCWFPLNRLGLVEKLDESDFVVRKHSVQFVGTNGVRSTPFYFFKHSDHPSSLTWQVVRSRFDQMLLDAAVAKGATFLSETAARGLLRDESGAVVGARLASAGGEPFEVHALVTVDATGRDAFAQKQSGWRIADERLRKVAIWSYWEGALRDPGLDEGATTIAYLPQKGWIWYLPLAGDVVSVGAVAERDYLFRDTRDLDAILEREVAIQPWVRKHCAVGNKREPARVTSDFTYRSRHCASEGLVLVGDAFSFLDPVFSSGVFLALQGGVLAGDAIADALAAKDVSGPRFEEYGARVCQGIEAMRRLVHAFYDTTFSFGKFLRAHPDQRAPLTDVLIGDLYKDFDPLFEAVAEFASIPRPLPHGAPERSAPR